MSLDKLNQSLQLELRQIHEEGRSKQPERIICSYNPPIGVHGPRYRIEGSSREYIRMNSNSYLSFSHHPRLLQVAEEEAKAFGVGPGAVRFIDGTCTDHVDLEKRVAQFTAKPAARIFNSAYTANCGLALTLAQRKTHWVGDQLNHNSIIRAMRIAGVPAENKSIYQHNDMHDLKRCLEGIEEGVERVVLVFDGIFSMRGDLASVAELQELADYFSSRFQDGVITVMDDSHGLGAYGETGRGTAEFCDCWPDIVVGTFGKAFGVNGGFVAASGVLIEAIRQKADTYIYTNPLSAADCAAARTALDICDSEEGRALLIHLQQRTRQFRSGLKQLRLESIPGPHPIVPLLIRDTRVTQKLVQNLFEAGILAVGLSYPVVPRGEELIRFQLNAAHTQADIVDVLHVLSILT